MKIPRQLIIKGAHWNVVITNTIKMGDDNVSILGLCDPSVRTIFIKKKQTQRQILSTFVHEVLHALEFEYEFDLGHKHIEKIEDPIADFIRDNLFDHQH